jgi:lysophospholipase L1-like esterase
MSDELLEAPLVGKEGARRPTALVPLAVDDAETLRFAVFYLSVAAIDADAIRIRLVDARSGAQAPLRRLAAPVNGGTSGSEAPLGALSESGRGALRRGDSAFWLDSTERSGLVPVHRLGVAVPEPEITAFTRLDVYTSTAPDGTPIGAASIAVVRDFLYMAVIGDSVEWGNGLPDKQKFSTLVMNAVEQETDRKVIRQVHAHSGARIVPAVADEVCTINCWGEVPKVSTSITLQADLIQSPEEMDFILVDGCINDVGVDTIFFSDITEGELVQLTEQYCGTEMTALLRKVREAAPNAVIVVTSYFPVVSASSDLLGMEQWATANGAEPDADGTEFKQLLVRNSTVFHETSNRAISEAVATINAESPADRPIVFAPVPFTDENATFAPQKWLWSLTDQADLRELIGDVSLTLFPEDPVLALRSTACLDAEALDGLLPCLYVSVAHPNAAGARAYADEIIVQLRQTGVMPGVNAAE